MKERGIIMKFFGFKISNPLAADVVNAVKTGSQEIVIDQLNQLETSLSVGEYIFIILGGDKVSWNKGLIGLAQITRAPFDKGYDDNNSRNFKLGIKMLMVLPDVIKREEFITYLDAYDAAGIGPNTKGEQNQAIKALELKQAVAIIRAMVDRDNSLEEKVKEIFDADFQSKVFGKIAVLTKEYLAYKEESTITQIQGSEVAGNTIVGRNILLYGVPGCGKSHTIDTQYIKGSTNWERVTFHPDYTYADFIGQVMPQIVDKQIEYRFAEGPFTRIMCEAVKNPGTMFYMIIEEINRGNAAAILGDVFQLLDRNDVGESKYAITNFEIADFIYGDKSHRIKIPSNLTILATMNTSDQSVFAIDTAFKRRWDMKLIPNNISKCKFARAKILDTEITWGLFVEHVNKIIAEEDTALLGNEDKRIGAYFVKADDLKMSVDAETGELVYNPAFAEKVLMYLWNDVFKYNREAIFKPEYKSLEELIRGFESVKFDVFNISFVDERESDFDE